MTNINKKQTLPVKTNLMSENIIKIENNNSNKNGYIWRQVYIDDSGKQVTVNIDMHTMSKEHLQKALFKCHSKLAQLKLEMDGWDDLIEKLYSVGESKNIVLEEPDTKFATIRRKVKNNNKTVVHK